MEQSSLTLPSSLTLTIFFLTMLFARTAFTNLTRRTGSQSLRAFAAKGGQAEVVLVGCGAPNRGMGWYHAVQMLEGR